jgi:hypothetical protein
LYRGAFAWAELRSNLAKVDAVNAGLANWDPQADSYVKCLAVTGDSIFAGGAFHHLGPDTRAGFAAIDKTTGLLSPLDVNLVEYPSVLRVSPDNERMYLGGYFSYFGTQWHTNIAELDLASGVITAWNPFTNLSVEAIEVAGDTVYLGGAFSQVMGQHSNAFAAVRAGGLVTSGVDARGHLELQLSSSPNPSLEGVRLRYSLPIAAGTELDDFDLSGRLVRSLCNRVLQSGEHSSMGWPRRSGRRVEGHYFARLTRTTRRTIRWSGFADRVGVDEGQGTDSPRHHRLRSVRWPLTPAKRLVMKEMGRRWAKR